MSVTIVLDTSAILAYTKGSIAVGELLSIVADDGDTVLIPAACLAEAFRRSTESTNPLLRVLSGVPCVELAPLEADQAAETGACVRGSAGIDIGHAVVEAVARNAQLATQNGVLTGRLLPPDWPIIEI